MTVPPDALDAAYAAAGQSLADPAGVRRCGDLIRLALEAAAPLIAAAERDRIRRLAETEAGKQQYAIAEAALREFADLLRGDQP